MKIQNNTKNISSGKNTVYLIKEAFLIKLFYSLQDFCYHMTEMNHLVSCGSLWFTSPHL